MNLKILIHFNSFEQKIWIEKIVFTLFQSYVIDLNELYDPSNFFLDLKSINHFVLIPA